MILALDVALVGVSAWLFVSPPTLDRSAEEQAAAAYQVYAKALDTFPTGPAECRSERDLDALDTALAGPLAPPMDYANRWRDTAAVRLYRKWLVDASLLRRHSRDIATEFDDATSDGESLLFEPQYDADWAARSSTLLSHSPTKKTGPVPESEAIPVRRGRMLRFEDIYETDLVRRAERDWSATAQRLTGIPDFFEFLSLIGARINSLPLMMAVLYR
jgi:hypothetical protein